MTVKKGELLEGHFSMSPNKRNVRDLDFKIKVGESEIQIITFSS